MFQWSFRPQKQRKETIFVIRISGGLQILYSPRTETFERMSVDNLLKQMSMDRKSSIARH